MLSSNQKTINKEFTLKGVGLHNGINAELTVKPAKENSGIKFCRIDLDKKHHKVLKKQCQHGGLRAADIALTKNII